MRVEENPDDEANNQVNKSSDNNDDDGDDQYNDEFESNTDEVVSKLIPSCVSLSKRTRESICRPVIYITYSNVYVGLTDKLSTFAAGFNDPGIIDLFFRFLHGHRRIDQRLLNRHRHHIDPKMSVVSSASSVYFAPSDRSGITGCKRELMRATPSWRKSSPRYDTILVRTGLAPGPHGLSVARLCLLFSFKMNGVRHEVALVEWFSYIGESPDDDTGMWVVEREMRDDDSPLMDFIDIGTILRSCHLLPVYGKEMISSHITHETSLDAFRAYYVNKFADHHSFEILT